MIEEGVRSRKGGGTSAREAGVVGMSFFASNTPPKNSRTETGFSNINTQENVKQLSSDLAQEIWNRMSCKDQVLALRTNIEGWLADDRRYSDKFKNAYLT